MTTYMYQYADNEDPVLEEYSAAIREHIVGAAKIKFRAGFLRFTQNWLFHFEPKRPDIQFGIPYERLVNIELKDQDNITMMGVMKHRHDPPDPIITFTFIGTDGQNHFVEFWMAQSLSRKHNLDECKRALQTLTAIGAIERSKRNSPIQTQKDDIIQQIEKLAELHKSGVLTTEEFTAKKAELLQRL